MRERIESKHVTKEIKSQMPVIPVEIVKERGCTFCPWKDIGRDNAIRHEKPTLTLASQGGLIISLSQWFIIAYLQEFQQLQESCQEKMVRHIFDQWPRLPSLHPKMYRLPEHFD